MFFLNFLLSGANLTSRVNILLKFLKHVGPNKGVGWRKKAVNLKQVGLLLVELQKIVPNKQVGWKIC